MTNDELSCAYEKYFDMVYRICFVIFHGNVHDTQDAVQGVFLKYLEHSGGFENPEHEKAWLIVTAKNLCKSMMRRVYRSHTSLEEAQNVAVDFEISEVLQAVMGLPEKEKLSVYLHYYEGYSAEEIGRILGCRENTVYSYLHRARKKLEILLGE